MSILRQADHAHLTAIYLDFVSSFRNRFNFWKAFFATEKVYNFGNRFCVLEKDFIYRKRFSHMKSVFVFGNC